MAATEIHLRQPPWLDAWLAQPAPANDEDRLAEVLALAAANLHHQSGGPFAAVVYDLAAGQRLAAAVNTVVSNHCAAAHAELQALALAQQAMGHHSLAGRPCLLVSSSAPCTMCLGAIAWSGIQQLLFATSRRDVEKIGFDEGPATPGWRRQLERRGIQVRGPMLRKQGLAVLAAYQGPVYNGR